MAESQKEILNIDEACRLLGVSAKTFAKILRGSDMPGRKIGREWKFSRQALIDWVGAAKAQDFIELGKNKTREKLKVEKVAPRGRIPLKRIARERFSVEED